MPHTQSRYQQDLGFSDGRVFIGPGDITVDVVAQVTAVSGTRNAAADWSINHVAAANTTNYAANLTNIILRRTGFGEDLQEQFGGTGIPASAQPQVYRPDVIGAMNTGQQLQPRTALKVKGIKLLSFDVIYVIGTANLVAHTCRVDQTTFVNNAAKTITSVLASAANGLATVTQANPYVTNVALAANQQVYRNLIDQQLWIEISSQTAATSVYQLYGIDCLCEFNYN
jgi:hypothetical protein